MIRIALLGVVFLAAACEPNGLYSSQDGEAFLKGMVRVGSTMREIEEALTANNIPFSEIAASDCGNAGDVWMDPRCVCAGGPALWLYLSENARPYNPFYSPTMNAFLAFDEEQSLASMAVIVLDPDE